LTLVDAAAPAVDDLDLRIRSLRNVKCICADVTKPALENKVREQYDAIFLLDVFQYFVDPAIALSNFARLLRGALFITYPNVLPPKGDGVNYFTRVETLNELLRTSGFGHWEVFAVELRPWAAALYSALHERPLRIYRSWHRKERNERPQTYENSWVFQQRKKLNRYKPLLHVTWTLLDQALRLGGDVFIANRVSDVIINRQLVIRAWK
jgi:hypothetical protein